MASHFTQNITEEVAYNVEGLSNPYLGLLPRLEDWYRRRNQTVKRAVFRPAHDPMLIL